MRPAPPFDPARIGAAALDALLVSMPKTELHLHIEGTLEPELTFELARRHGVSLPYADVAALRAAYDFRDLQSFLDLYYAGAAVLRTEEDFEDLALAWCERAAAEGVVHAEVFFDPQTHTARGVSMATVIGGLTRAADIALTEYGLSVAWILCFLRHLSEEEAFATLEQALPFRERFIGVGLDSSERGHPPGKFERVFARCRQLGLRVVAHAGEEGPPAYIEGALDALHAERIDHGVRCLEDPALVQRLVRQQVPLTVCPLSNLRLCVVPTLAVHPLKTLLDAGLVVTVNSDDPAYFGGTLLDNYRAVIAALGLDAGDVWCLARHSIDASFAPGPIKAGWRAELDRQFVAAAA